MAKCSCPICCYLCPHQIVGCPSIHIQINVAFGFIPGQNRLLFGLVFLWHVKIGNPLNDQPCWFPMLWGQEDRCFATFHTCRFDWSDCAAPPAPNWNSPAANGPCASFKLIVWGLDGQNFRLQNVIYQKLKTQLLWWKYTFCGLEVGSHICVSSFYIDCSMIEKVEPDFVRPNAWQQYNVSNAHPTVRIPIPASCFLHKTHFFQLKKIDTKCFLHGFNRDSIKINVSYMKKIIGLMDCFFVPCDFALPFCNCNWCFFCQNAVRWRPSRAVSWLVKKGLTFLRRPDGHQELTFLIVSRNLGSNNTTISR